MVKGSVEGSVWQTVRNCVANFVLNWLPLKLSLIETSPWNLRYPPVGTDASFLCQVQQPLLTSSTELIIFCFFFQIGIPCIGFLPMIIKAHGVLSLICRTFNCNLPTGCKRKLYVTLILPHPTYCSPVWRPSLIKDIVLLEKIQRRATKYILNHTSAT